MSTMSHRFAVEIDGEVLVWHSKRGAKVYGNKYSNTYLAQNEG